MRGPLLTNHPLTLGLKMKVVGAFERERLNELEGLVKPFELAGFTLPTQLTYHALEMENHIHVLENAAYYYYEYELYHKAISCIDHAATIVCY